MSVSRMKFPKAVAKLRETHGPITTLIHNASAAHGDGLQGTTVEDFEASWRATTLGGFTSAREIVPDMLAAGGGTMLFTGATSSVRGGGWLAFSSAKFALRGMVQSMARELWPKEIHVAHVVVDGIITAPGEDETDEPELDPHQHGGRLLASGNPRTIRLDARIRSPP